MDEPGVEAHFHNQLHDVRGDQDVTSSFVNRSATMLRLVVDSYILSRSLTYPEEDPDKQVHNLDSLKALPFFQLLSEGD